MSDPSREEQFRENVPVALEIARSLAWLPKELRNKDAPVEDLKLY